MRRSLLWRLAQWRKNSSVSEHDPFADSSTRSFCKSLRGNGVTESGTRVRFPPPPLSNSLNDNELPKWPNGLAASGQRRPDAAGQRLASDDAILVLPSSGNAIALTPAVVRIAEAWPSLPPHICEAILTLVDAGDASRGLQVTRDLTDSR